MRKFVVISTALSLFLVLPSLCFAEYDWYLGGSVSYLFQADSDNGGSTGDFTTGNGAPALPLGTPIADGTPYGWDTEFDDGWALSGEVGVAFDNGLRTGLEIIYSDADVDTHEGVTVGGTNIDGVDAAALTGSATQLGASVGQIVADGRGNISTAGAFLNIYYDFVQLGSFVPYVGAGVGFVWADVEYEPSGVKIIDDDDTVFGLQLKAGASYRLSSSFDIYGEYAYRVTEDIEVSNSLFPGDLEIENEQHLLTVGLRYRFPM